MSTINSTILSVMRRRQVKGLTVGEIYDRVSQQYSATVPAYSTVRARVYELANSGKLYCSGDRKDTISGRFATTFVRPS